MIKMLSLFLSFFLAFSVLLPYQQAEAIHSLEVIAYPRKVGTIATYRFIFTAEEKLETSQWVKLGFPRGTTMPPLPEERRERDRTLIRILESMYMSHPGRFHNCNLLTGGLPILTFYDDGSLESIQFNICCATLDPDDEVKRSALIIVHDVSGIKTPAEEGFYEYSVSTESEPTPVTTLVEMVESQIGVPEGIPQVRVDPPVASFTAGYEIQFHVGRGGRLLRSRESIDIRFPEGTRFTKPFDTMDPGIITINGIPTRLYPENKSDRLSKILSLATPITIPDSGQVRVWIAPEAGIMTPPSTGPYQWEVRTSFDDWATSKETALMEAKDYASLSGDPNTIGRISTYTVRFIPQADLPEDSILAIRFPEQVGFEEELMHVYLEETLVPFDLEGFTLAIKSVSQSLSQGKLCHIRITGIRNPDEPQTLRVRLSLPDHPDRFSSPLDIVTQPLQINDFEFFPLHAHELADYRIEILFNDERYPSEGDVLSIDLGFGGPPFERAMDHLEGIEPFTVILPDIMNPEPGDYVLTVSLLGESVEHPFTILPALPSSTIRVEAKGDKGDKQPSSGDWWTSPPTISFEKSDRTATIYYWWNDQEEELKVYNEPFTLEPGQYKSVIRFYAENDFGREKLQFKEIWVDTVPPEVEVITPLSDIVLTNELGLEIEARLMPTELTLYGRETRTFYDHRARINGKRVTVNQEDGSFSKIVLLEEGENTILVEAEDVAGNSWSRAYSVTLDTVAPQITLTHPKNRATVAHREREVLIQGILSKPAELLMDGIIIEVEEDGSFEHVYLTHIGLNEIVFQATDQVGNFTEKVLGFYYGYTIQLQVGNKQAIVNDEPQEMLLAPFIEGGRTLVPFRFIGESLGAAIDFTLDPQTRLVHKVTYRLEDNYIVLTIGSTLAEVNGLPVKLEVAPNIIEGTTVVPLRFIAENLGCKVEWEADEQIITLLYPE